MKFKFNYKNIIIAFFIVGVIFCCIQDFSYAADVATKAGGPISIKKTALKFLIAMGGVVISSLVLYVGLLFYNKFRNKNTVESTQHKFPSEFDSPDSVESAIKIFINKNKL